MRNMFFAIAMTLAGVFALTGATSAAPISNLAQSSEATLSSEMLQPVGGYWWGHQHKGKKFIWFGKKIVLLPKGYYKGFCYDYPGHWWCKKYFFKRSKNFKTFKKFY